MSSRNWRSSADLVRPYTTPTPNANAPRTLAATPNAPKSTASWPSGDTALARESRRVGDAAICIDCAGTGRHFGPCDRCNGKGVTCPKCRGMRFVRMRTRGHQQWETEVIRCPVCMEGNNVNEIAEVRAIRAYIALADALPASLPEQKEGQP